MLLYQEIYFVCAADKTVFLILNTFLFSSADMRLILVPQTSVVRRALLFVTVYLAQRRGPSADTGRAVGRQPVPTSERWGRQTRVRILLGPDGLPL